MNKEQNKFIIQNVVFHTTERITGILKSVSKKLPEVLIMYVYIMNKEQNKFIIQNVVFHTTERITGILKSVSKIARSVDNVCIYNV